MIEQNKLYRMKDTFDNRRYWFTSMRTNGYGDKNPEGIGFEVVVCDQYGMEVETKDNFLYNKNEYKFEEVDEVTSKEIIERMLDVLLDRITFDKRAVKALKKFGGNDEKTT